MSPKCYRCGGETESRDNIAGWGFFGGSVTSETERTEVKRIRVLATSVRYTDIGPIPTVCDDRMPLCRTCWLELMTFLGVGKRKEWLR